jgi:hypothetical protein
MTDFDNEYVWHCHLLGHEEQDFMRPFIFHPTVVVPDAPATVTVSGSTVTWVDTTPYGGQDAQGIPTAGTNAAYPTPTSSPKNEIGFKVYANVTLDANGNVPAGAVPVATVPANVTTLVDASGALAAAVAATVAPAVSVAVVAYNAAGDSFAGTSVTTTTAGAIGAPAAPVVTPGTNAVAGALIDATGTTVTVASTAGLVVGASVTGGGFPPGTVITAITSTTTFTTSAAGTPTVAPGAALTISKVAATALPTPAASTGPGGLTQTLNANGTTTLAWTAVSGATSYSMSITETTGAAGTPANTTLAPVVVTLTTPVSTSLTASIDATGRTVLVTTGTVAGLFVGESVSGGGFPAGTIITAINVAANSFTTSVSSTTPNLPGLALTAVGVPPTYTTGLLNSGSTYAFAVTATTLSGTTVAATAGLTNSPTQPPVAFTGAADAVGSGAVTLQWANNVLNKNNVAGMELTWTPAGGTAVVKTFVPTTTGATVTGLTIGTAYSFTLRAVSNVAAFNSTYVPVAPATLTVTAQ